MNAKQLREKAKKILRNRLIIGSDADEFVDCIIDAAIAEIVENHQVDVPNTGYFGIIVEKENKP